MSEQVSQVNESLINQTAAFAFQAAREFPKEASETFQCTDDFDWNDSTPTSHDHFLAREIVRQSRLLLQGAYQELHGAKNITALNPHIRYRAFDAWDDGTPYTIEILETHVADAPDYKAARLNISRFNATGTVDEHTALYVLGNAYYIMRFSTDEPSTAQAATYAAKYQPDVVRDVSNLMNRIKTREKMKKAAAPQAAPDLVAKAGATIIELSAYRSR